MGTIKQDRKDLEMLLNGVAPIANTPAFTGQPMPAQPSVIQQPAKPTAASVVDNTQGTALEEQRVFDFDYDGIKKGLRKKARKTVANLTKHILTPELMEAEYVKDKMEQDIESLADLYMQVECNNIMQRSILDTVSRGTVMPRMYEVFGQLTDKIQAINKQIMTTEQQIRKTYLDIKYEIKDKETEMLGQQANTALPGPSKPNSTIITSSKQLIEMAKKRHADKLKQAKETECVEE